MQHYSNQYNDNQIPSPATIGLIGANRDCYIFDLDALCHGFAGRLNEAAVETILCWAQRHPSYLIASSNYHELTDRVPEQVRSAFAGVFASAGTEFWQQDRSVSQNTHLFTDDVYEFVARVAQTSPYPEKQAPLIDCGPGTLRLTLAGRNATPPQRNAFLDWDKETGELDSILSAFENRFSDYRMCRDQSCSLLISHRSSTSSQILTTLDDLHPDAHVVGFASVLSLEGYARPLVQAAGHQHNMMAVDTPCDILQLLRYEERRHRCEPVPYVSSGSRRGER